VLDLKTGEKTYEELEHRAGELEREIYKVKQAEETLRRQNNYLTALHETSLDLIDHLDKEKLLEAVLQSSAMLTGTEHGFIYLLEPGDSEMQMQVGMGFFKYFNLTPMEIRVANLVKEGKTNKEIEELLCLSKNTILFHRYNIRDKLGLKNKKINLRTHLLLYDR
jgi:DNA-binding CsgD family transcriptional regulator